MNFKLKKAVDPDILRSLGLPEDLKEGDNATIEEQYLWNHGIYDEESAKIKFGDVFEIPEAPTKKKSKTGGGE